MQMVIEWTETEVLLREALAARGVAIHPDAEMVIRVNNKGQKQTARLVFKGPVNTLDESCPESSS